MHERMVRAVKRRLCVFRLWWQWKKATIICAASRMNVLDAELHVAFATVGMSTVLEQLFESCSRRVQSGKCTCKACESSLHSLGQQVESAKKMAELQLSIYSLLKAGVKPPTETRDALKNEAARFDSFRETYLTAHQNAALRTTHGNRHSQLAVKSEMFVESASGITSELLELRKNIAKTQFPTVLFFPVFRGLEYFLCLRDQRAYANAMNHLVAMYLVSRAATPGWLVDVRFAAHGFWIALDYWFHGIKDRVIALVSIVIACEKLLRQWKLFQEWLK